MVLSNTLQVAHFISAHISLLKLGHLITSNCKGIWEMESRHVLRNNGGLDFEGQLLTHLN